GGWRRSHCPERRPFPEELFGVRRVTFARGRLPRLNRLDRKPEGVPEVGSRGLTCELFCYAVWGVRYLFAPRVPQRRGSQPTEGVARQKGGGKNNARSNC